MASLLGNCSCQSTDFEGLYVKNIDIQELANIYVQLKIIHFIFLLFLQYWKLNPRALYN